MTKFFTGKPCVRGHIAERWAANRTCVECNREDVRNRNVRRYRASEVFADNTKANQYNTRARKFGSEGKLSGDDLRAVRASQNGLCTCGKGPIEVFDHIIALWKQGPNTRTNLRGLCQTCDEVKFSSDHREWHAAKGLSR